MSKARQWLASRRGAIADKRLFPERQATSDPLFSVHAAAWLASCRVRGLKRSTLQRYETHLAHHRLPSLGTLRLNEIDRARVRALAVDLQRRGLAPKTIHNALRALSAIFSQAYEDQLVATNLALRPSRLVTAARTRTIEVFTVEEEALILAAAREHLPLWYPFVLTLFRSGLRLGEAVALKPEDVDVRSRYLLVRRNVASGQWLEDSPKSAKPRRVDLATDLLAVLQEHLALREADAALERRPPSDWLFCSPNGTLIQADNFRHRSWTPLLGRLAIRHRPIHAIRHTFATRLIMAGAPLIYVQKQLGHSSIQMTADLYTHWIELADRAASADAPLPIDLLVPSS